MGAKLLQFYDQAKLKGGISAQIKLAMLTKMSSAPDSPENIKIFEEAIKKI